MHKKLQFVDFVNNTSIITRNIQMTTAAVIVYTLSKKTNYCQRLNSICKWDITFCVKRKKQVCNSCVACRERERERAQGARNIPKWYGLYTQFARERDTI